MGHSVSRWLDHIGKLSPFVEVGVIAAGLIKAGLSGIDTITIWLLLIGVGGGLWTLCYHIVSKRLPPLIEDGKGVWQYPRGRRLARIGLFLIPALIIGGASYHTY
jgi:hypothetical protein